MKSIGITLLIYGALVLVGGVMGHLQAGSQASLIAGLSCGIALLICSFFAFRGKLPAAYTALILTFLLDAFFTYRFSHTLKFFPSGMMSVVSLITLIVLAIQLKKERR